MWEEEAITHLGIERCQVVERGEVWLRVRIVPLPQTSLCGWNSRSSPPRPLGGGSPKCTMRGRATSSYGSPRPMVSHTRNLGRRPVGAQISCTASMNPLHELHGAPPPPRPEAMLESALTLITENTLYYRGYDAIQLARAHTLEEVAALLWTGRLEQAEQLFATKPLLVHRTWPSVTRTYPRSRLCRSRWRWLPQRI